MARNSRFRSTSGPSSNRPHAEKRTPFKKGPGKRNDRDDKPGFSPNRKAPFKKFDRPFKGQGRGTGTQNTDSSESKNRSDFSKRSPRPFSKDNFTRRKSETPIAKIERRESEGRKPPERDKPYAKKEFVKPGRGKENVPEVNASEPSGLIRLNKFISNSGICSRREADELITAGVITVNGKSITELGHKVNPTDDVRYEGKRLKSERPVYILLNKPKGYITTTDDPQERNTVMHLIQGACKERVYPVGRLDRNTSGLLLLTNDGDLTEKLTHPSHKAKKIYKVELDKPITKTDFQKVIDGVHLEEGKAPVDELAIISDDGKTVGLEIHVGWNRVVRRIFEALGYEVVKLDRTVYATLDKKDLQRGHWRFLRQDEVVRLKHFQ